MHLKYREQDHKKKVVIIVACHDLSSVQKKLFLDWKIITCTHIINACSKSAWLLAPTYTFKQGYVHKYKISKSNF